MMRYDVIEHYTLFEYIDKFFNRYPSSHILNSPSKWATSAFPLIPIIQFYIAANDTVAFANACVFVNPITAPEHLLTPKEYVESLWTRIKAKFGEWIVFAAPVGKELSDIEKTSAMCDIIEMINNTYEKYSTILNLYESEKDNLLKGGGRSYTRTTARDTSGENENVASGVDKFKDTPQADIDPASDNYNSEVRYTSGHQTQSTSLDEDVSETYSEEMTPESVMTRLTEVTTKIFKTWEAWLNEFQPLFISPLNI